MKKILFVIIAVILLIICFTRIRGIKINDKIVICFISKKYIEIQEKVIIQSWNAYNLFPFAINTEIGNIYFDLFNWIHFEDQFIDETHMHNNIISFREIKFFERDKYTHDLKIIENKIIVDLHEIEIQISSSSERFNFNFIGLQKIIINGHEERIGYVSYYPNERTIVFLAQGAPSYYIKMTLEGEIIEINY